MEIKCPACNQYIDADSKFCPSCGRAMTTSGPETVARQTGQDLKSKEVAKGKPCPYCSETIQKGALKCKHCGEFLDGIVRRKPLGERKNKSTAALLAIFLGGIGIHKFYLDQPKTGLLYLLFCWFLFIPAIIGFFEGIGLIMSSQEDFDRRYN